jgi:hypothetical protein
MKKHLTDEEIQDYALEPSGCAAEIAQHAEGCPECTMRIKEYRLLFGAFEGQPESAFDFNIEEAVLSRLPVAKQHEPVGWLSYALFFVVVVPACGGIYIFRNVLLNVFSQIATLVLLLIVITVATILTVLCVDMFKSFQKKIHAVDGY